jgi:hypothetical protein
MIYVVSRRQGQVSFPSTLVLPCQYHSASVVCSFRHCYQPHISLAVDSVVKGNLKIISILQL